MAVAKTKPVLIPTEMMRPEDRARERIPWREMKIGGIYQRKDGRYFIYAGKATVYHTFDTSMCRVSDKLAYVYIYIDAPGMLNRKVSDTELEIICSSAKLRTSEYRDIARCYIGDLPEFDCQDHWILKDYTIVTDPSQKRVGSTKTKIVYSPSEQAALKASLAPTAKSKAKRGRKRITK